MWELLLLVAASCFGACVVRSYLHRKRKSDEPPLVEGNWLLGSAADFSRDAISFLHSASSRYGSVFTVRFIHYHITVIMDPHCVHLVARNKNFVFEPIQNQVNFNVFNHTVHDSSGLIREVTLAVNGNHLDQTMANFAARLNVACDRLSSHHLQQQQDTALNSWTNENIRVFVARTALDAIVTTLFGQTDNDEIDTRTVFESFEVFHRYWNYLWLGLPIWLFPKAASSYDRLSKFCPEVDDLLMRPDIAPSVRGPIGTMIASGQSNYEIKGHNLIYLHINYNTFKLAYWALVNLLENPDAMAALLEEIRQTLGTDRNGTTQLSMEDVNQMKILDSVTLESVRLASGVFMIRHVLNDTYFTAEDGQEYFLRGGDKVAIYPPSIHMNPDIFEKPTTFKYDRFIDGGKFHTPDGRPVRQPLLAFGTLCPGKRLALMQVKWFLVTILTRFQIRIENLSGHQRVQYDTTCYGHEVLPPLNDVSRLQFKPLQSHPVFVYANGSKE